MDDERFDHIARHVSRRGLASVVAAGVLAVTTAAAEGARRKRRLCLRKPPRDACGGFPTEFSSCCAGLRTCATDDDCAPTCECIERGAGCCFRTRRGKHRGSSRCIRFANALRCTPRAAEPL